MFIALEGIEGCGKSTLIAKLTQAFTERGREVVATREPGAGEFGRTLRAILLDPAQVDLAPEAELFLFLADRAQHVHSLIRPALAAGKVVLCDRYVDSTIVYQGLGRGLDVAELERLNAFAVKGLWPDLTLVLDLDPEIGLVRAKARDAALGREGRFESLSLDFHRRVRAGYLDLAGKAPGRYAVLDARLSPDAVCAAALTALDVASETLRTVTQS